MEIIIVGCGKVGYALAKSLSAENGVNITILDHKAEALEKAGETIDAMLVRGDGLSSEALVHAGAKEADLLIAVTDSDEKNILCCISAKHLGVKYTIARIRTPEYALDANRFWKSLGLDMIINPEQETAREISRLLRFPTAEDIDIFAGGRVELVSFSVSEAPDFFVGKSVSQIFHKKGMNVLLATVERGESVIIPHGDLILEQDDLIRVLGRPSHIMSFFSLIGKNTQRIKNLTIIGGGKITYYLVELLHRHSSETKVKIIEMDREKCEELSVRFPQCLVINADGTDDDVLSLENADKAGAMVCLTNRDEENAIISLYALQKGMRKVVVKINHINPNMVGSLKLGSIVSPKNITCEQIVRYIRGLTYDTSGVKTVRKIFHSEHSKVEAIEFVVSKAAKCLDTPIKNIKMKKGILLGSVVRNSNIVVPNGDTVLRLGDSVVIIAKDDDIHELDDILAE